jgi:hypothetical protein
VIGLAYLLTREEYERLLDSEGGRDGGYKEIDVTVVPLLELSSAIETAVTENIICKSLETRCPRENPSPLPSLRYLSLIRSGATEHLFPSEYLAYLDQLNAYKISSWRTEAGRILFLGIWLPVVVLMFAMMAMYWGRTMPKWLRRFQEWTFSSMWKMHDSVFRHVFGPGDVIVALDTAEWKPCEIMMLGKC